MGRGIDLADGIDDDVLRSQVERLYAALRRADRDTLQQLLAPTMVAVMTQSLPFGIGGAHTGADAMFAEVWGPAIANFVLRPEPEEIIPLRHDRVFVVGRYIGAARATGRDLNAAFVHMLRFSGKRVSEWIQVTDSAAWISALQPDHSPMPNAAANMTTTRGSLAPSVVESRAGAEMGQEDQHRA